MINAFSVCPQVVSVPDLFLTAVKLTHNETGAQYLHAARDDSNNLFRLVGMFFFCFFFYFICGITRAFAAFELQ